MDEPWAHAAEGVELQWVLREHPDRGGGFYADQWEVWQFKDALLRRDANGVASARARARTYAVERMAESSWWGPGDIFFPLVWHALAARDLAGAADDLCYWLSVSSSDDVENNNTNRTNCRQVIDMAARVLGAPSGTSSPRMTEIRDGVLRLAEGAFSVLNRDQQAAVMQISRA